MDVHFKLLSEEQSSTVSSTVLTNPIMQSVKGHENILPAKCSPLTCSTFWKYNVSLVPKAGWGLILFVQKTNFKS